MKILFCIKGLYNSGGMEKVLTDRVNYFIKNYKFECIILTTDQKNRKVFFNLDKEVILEDLGINYSDSNKNIFIRGLQFLKKQKKHKEKLIKCLQKYNPDVIISFGDQDKNLWPKLKTRAKLILEHHFEKYYKFKEENGVFQKIKNFIFLKKEEKFLKFYDEFIVLTEEDKKQYNSDKIKVIKNPIMKYDEQYSKLKNKKAISVGRLCNQKGYDLLIKVWNEVVKSHKDWILEIYGEGEKREELENEIKKLKLEKNIFLKGNTNKIYEKYLESSIYIMTSRYEGLPMVLIEAQSAGLPIVSFDCPCGPKDIISENISGYLCKFGNIIDMSQKVIDLAENIEKRKEFGRNAKKNSLNYDSKIIMEQWKKIIES